MRAALGLVAVPSPEQRACPDCPTVRNGLLESLVFRGAAKCAMPSQAFEARTTVPSTWAERHSFAIVRRGWLMRSRIDGRGSYTAVDVAGPGALVPLRGSAGAAVSSLFAASRVVLCFCPDDQVDPSCSDPNIAFDLLRLHQQALDRVERIADARGREGAIEKVTTLLTVLAELRGDTSGRLRLPDGLQQRDIAALLQMRPETVCRALRALESESSNGATVTRRRADE